MRIFIDPVGVSAAGLELLRHSELASDAAKRALADGFVGAPPAMMGEAIGTCSEVVAGTQVSHLHVLTLAADLARRVTIAQVPGAPLGSGAFGDSWMTSGSGLNGPGLLANSFGILLFKAMPFAPTTRTLYEDGEAVTRWGWEKDQGTTTTDADGHPVRTHRETFFGKEWTKNGPSVGGDQSGSSGDVREYGKDRSTSSQDWGFNASASSMSGFAGLRRRDKTDTDLGAFQRSDEVETMIGGSYAANGGAMLGPDGVMLGAGGNAFLGASRSKSIRIENTYVGGEVSAGVAAGIGVDGDIGLLVTKKDVHFGLHAKAVVGLGGNVGFDVSVNPERIYQDKIAQPLENIGDDLTQGYKTFTHQADQAGDLAKDLAKRLIPKNPF